MLQLLTQAQAHRQNFRAVCHNTLAPVLRIEHTHAHSGTREAHSGTQAPGGRTQALRHQGGVKLRLHVSLELPQLRLVVSFLHGAWHRLQPFCMVQGTAYSLFLPTACLHGTGRRLLLCIRLGGRTKHQSGIGVVLAHNK